MPSAERVSFCLALALVASARLMLFVVPSRVSLRLVRWLADMRARTRVSDRPSSAHLAWAVASASRLVPRATCLTQAVAAKLLFAWYGFHVRLCLGVARVVDGELTAHAWIEHHGRVILGGAESASFARFPSLAGTLPRKRGAAAR
jgi:hypothetical protein